LARHPIEITARQQQTERTLLDWLRVGYAIEKPNNKLSHPGHQLPEFQPAGKTHQLVRYIRAWCQ
jgi:hypothetical protein